MALARLHNLCIGTGDVPVRERFHADIVKRDEFDVMLNEDFLDEEEQLYITTSRSGTNPCNHFRILLEEKRLCRPNYNMNSRA
jgi:hypothetical protein